ncbi:hypothetical protein LTR99_005687 [Exophiala xenobiotica]|uniref:Armadillo repeat-containing protein 8 n=1 Tax=Vermiconidia calcicola TaxID=1690605 RepID=A0AAV9QIC6_9PEZI|nr:hypothetical protein LTR92_006422 [Exophiala xenobiotica]KAK5540313.1 hypothetical protein LTR23_006410 [Chaetothyriales sp. CCFEE 6169]KAK5541239.1 hypothetical protein LTR25_003016 [Vermiconidia calcicola]KAK5270303.1 hypothetical protein LTR96_004804 [Exophiala xenobiotica]KAK5302730.1 hypothetical protein LTR99_005687 [Exophiala xenobiotica]
MAFSTRPATTVLQPLHDLRAAADTSAHLQALRKIKNELSGHLSRKIEYIHNGLIHLLAKSLASLVTTLGNAQPTDDDELTCTHAAQLLYLIAHEGPAFVQPILETDVSQSLISCLLQPLSPKTALAVLRCLNAIADNLPPSSSNQWSQDGRLAELLYSKKYLQCCTKFVKSASDTVLSQQASDALLALLCKTVSQEYQKRALVDSGMLSLLAARLASFVVAEGLVPPGSEAVDRDNSVFCSLPDPAPPFAHLSPVLETICLLTEGSKTCTAMFLADPAIQTVLPEIKDDFSPGDIRRAPWGASYFSGGAVPRSRLQGPFDSLLPLMPVAEKVNSPAQLSFPPLGAITAMPKRRASFLPTTTETPQLNTGPYAEDVEESSVGSWLLYIVRASRGKRRLLAARLLVSLYSLDFVKKERGASFASLLVPLLTRMLEADTLKQDPVQQNNGVFLSNGLHYAKAVPGVLSTLIMDDPVMQRVAVEGRAIANLSTGLKATFDSHVGRKSPPWLPHKNQTAPPDSSIPGTTIGPGGPTSAIRREMEYREGCLQALAAIAPFEDDYRKEICDQGVLQHIMQALEPYQIQYGPGQQMDITGNSGPVILAACGAVRVLTRSVKALRTKLIEAEVAKPIIKLMNSRSPEVRIAATRVLANLAIDFSPVKESVGEPSVVKKLCEQAHSANARLRLESLWALKQLVLNASKKLKQDVVDELGPSWIKLLIKTDPVDIPEGEVIGLVERDYPPLAGYGRSSANIDRSDDVVMGEESEGDHDDTHPLPGGAVGDAALDQTRFDTRHTREDDTEIQAQLLDLLRNLFCGENASDLVKYIFDEMGQDDFFRIMLDRLRPRTLAGPTRKENYTTPAPAGVVIKVLYILVHIGACEPKWRNVIASQHPLMKQVLTYAGHVDREIRAQVCWIAINLTYEDDAGDRVACRQRAAELQKVGFVTHLRRLESDSDLNVRERAKSAMHLMSKLLAT